jgi:hypothetical protein
MQPILKSTVLTLALLAASQAHAISRYNSESMSCGEAQSRVIEEGAVILRYHSQRNPSLTLYDRYVAHRGFCRMDEYAKAAWVPTADTPSCPVYTCEPQNFDDFPFGHD